MKKFNKEFKFRDFYFNTSIELYTRQEKKLNGKIWHTVKTIMMSDDYDFEIKDEIESFNLEFCIESHYIKACEYVDKIIYNKYKNEDFDVQLLINLGFKNNQ